MDKLQPWIAVMTALSAGAVLQELVRGIVKWINGAAGRERGRNANLVKQRDDAYARAAAAEKAADEADARADAEARKRLLEEYASSLRRDCMDHGVRPDELRPWPTY